MSSNSALRADLWKWARFLFGMLACIGVHFLHILLKLIVGLVQWIPGWTVIIFWPWFYWYILTDPEGCSFAAIFLNPQYAQPTSCSLPRVSRNTRHCFLAKGKLRIQPMPLRLLLLSPSTRHMVHMHILVVQAILANLRRPWLEPQVSHTVMICYSSWPFMNFLGACRWAPGQYFFKIACLLWHCWSFHLHRGLWNLENLETQEEATSAIQPQSHHYLWWLLFSWGCRCQSIFFWHWRDPFRHWQLHNMHHL